MNLMEKIFLNLKKNYQNIIIEKIEPISKEIKKIIKR